MEEGLHVDQSEFTVILSREAGYGDGRPVLVLQGWRASGSFQLSL